MTNIPIQPNMIPMRDVKLISEGDRLFYELGYKISGLIEDYEGNWIGTGQFMEIPNVQAFIKKEDRLIIPGFLEHHNFMLIKNEHHEKVQSKSINASRTR